MKPNPDNTAKPNPDNTASNHRAANGVASAWLVITVVMLVAPALLRVSEWSVPTLLIGGLIASASYSIWAIAGSASGRLHSVGSHGLLLHVGNLATVFGVVVAGVVQVLTQRL
jgi:hypothetical protein